MTMVFLTAFSNFQPYSAELLMVIESTSCSILILDVQRCGNDDRVSHIFPLCTKRPDHTRIKAVNTLIERENSRQLTRYTAHCSLVRKEDITLHACILSFM